MTEFIISDKELDDIFEFLKTRQIMRAKSLLRNLRLLEKENFSHNTIINEKTKSMLDGEFPKEVRKSEEKRR